MKNIEKETLTIWDFLVQQNKYKSTCKTHVIEHDDFKFFVILDLQDKINAQHTDEILDGIKFSFNKLLKTQFIDSSSVEQIFEQSIQDLNKYIFELITISNIPINLEQLHGLIGLVINETLIVTQRGFVHGFMSYKTKDAQYKLIDILAEGTQEPSSQFVFNDIITGQLSKNQALMFTTANVGNYLTEYNIKNALKSNDITRSTLESHLKEITNNENFAGIVLRYSAEISPLQKKELPIENTTNQINTSLKRLEKNRERTQELLSPSIFVKTKNLISKYQNKLKIKKDLFKPQKKDLVKDTISKEVNQTSEKSNILDSTTISITPILKKLASKSKEYTIKLKKTGLVLIHSIRNPKTFKQQFSGLKLTPYKGSKLLNKQKKSTQIIAISIIAVILIIIVSSLTIKSKKEKQIRLEQYQQIILNIDNNLTKAESSIIHKAEGRATIHINKAEQLIAQLQPYQDLIDVSNQTSNYNTKINELEQKINHIISIDNPELFIDLNAQYIQDQIKGIEIKNETIYTYAFNNPYIALINTKSKDLTLIDTPDNNILVSQLNIFEKEKNTPVLLTDDGQIYKLNKISNKLQETNLKFETNIKDIKTYNSNLYALIPSINQIKKYTRLGNTSFNTGKNWIISQDIDLSTATDMHIDGSIYILHKNGTIKNFLSGKLTSFKLESNITPAVSDAQKLRYSEATKRFYILEPNNNRILVYSDTGEFIQQYVLNSLNEMKDIIFDDKTKLLYILNKSSIYKIEG